MAITTRQDLIEYCLRRLGKPVIEINVAEQQLEDRLQDALDFWGEFFFDGVERMYLKTQITASELTFSTAVTGSFTLAEKLTGGTSGATAKAFKVKDSSTFYIQVQNGTFVAGETVTGDQSAFSATVATNGFTLGNWDRQYIEVPDTVVGISRLLTLGPGTAGTSPRNIFDVVYQFRQTDLYDLLSTDLIYYAQVKMHLQMLDMMFPGDRSLRFNRVSGRLFIDMNWHEVLNPGDFIVVECFRTLDPATAPKIYNDIWLKRYATALIKRQWATNLSLFEGIKLLGGVTLNGPKLFDEAQKEIEFVENAIRFELSEPPFFAVG